MNKTIRLHECDNVAVVLLDVAEDERLDGGVTAKEVVAAGHKIALFDIAAGSVVRKYGVPVARATRDIPAGSWVHTHNVETMLSGEDKFVFTPDGNAVEPNPHAENPTIMAFERTGGSIGIRNEVWVVPTVGCVNHLAERLAKASDAAKPANVDAVVAFSHPYGCSPPGDDLERTRAILANFARHPNAAGVLYVGLGCENNVMSEFRRAVEQRPSGTRTAFMVAQDVEDEMAEGMRLLAGLLETAGLAVRRPAPVSKLCVGMKCGASDGLSGITANPLLGAFSDWLVALGGRTILTEVPEMFGAETALLNRSASASIFSRGAAMITEFKRYFIRHGRTIDENPSPGNRRSGLSTLEDKSIGCVQKAGRGKISDILPYGGLCTQPGVTLLSGPGEDMVSVSNLAAAGAHLVLFSTGTGNPLGAPVPVVKVASNAALASRKSHWIDFNAAPLAAGESMAEVLARFIAHIIEVASGKLTRNEESGYRDFTIFKDGVTL